MTKDGGKGSGIKGHKTPQQKKIEEADKWVDEYYSDQATIKKLEAEIRHQYQVIANERDNTKTQKKAIEAETKIKNLEDQVKKLKSKWKWMEDMAITKDTMEILRLSGFTVDEEVSPKFKKVMEEFGKGELESSSGEKVTDPKQAKAIAYSESKDDDLGLVGKHVWVKSKGDEWRVYVLQDKGSKLYIRDPYNGTQGWVDRSRVTGLAPLGKTSKDGGPGSGIKGHTTESSEENFWENKLREVAKQKGISESDIESLISQVKKGGAKAVMSQKENNDSCGEKVYTKGTEDGYKMEDPKEIEAAIKKVKESGHPNPQYLAGLQRALEIAKQERGIKDDDATKEGSIKEYGQENSHKMEDSDPRVREAEAIINLTGGIK